MKIKHVLLLVLLTMCALRFAVSSVEAQGTAFTYQGQLNASGSPANGHYDFTFALYNNNATNSGQLGITQTNLNVGVTNGLFTVTNDFGANFPGANRWLAIGARTNGAASFTALTPLQQLTPTPYAIYSGNAGTAASANSVPAGDISGMLTLGQLPGTLVTNDQTGVNLSGSFTGNGSTLTNIPLTGLATDDSLALTSSGLSFLYTGAFAAGIEPYSVTPGTNLNGLGHVDMVMSDFGTNQLTVLTNNGSGGFAIAETLGVGIEPFGVAVADVNGDGRPDLICGNLHDGTLTILTNTGSGFISNVSLNVGALAGPVWPVAVSNLNGLGHIDLVCADFGTNTLTIFTNNGTGKFTLFSTVTVGASPSGIAVADVNHLGRPDLICCNNGTNTVTLLVNIGSGEFVPETYTVGNGPFSILAVDVNGDGWVDLVTANETDGSLTVLTNNGSGSFVLASTLTGLGTGGGLAAGSLNGNGVPDLVCTTGASVQVMLNTGNGTFALGPTLLPNGPDLTPNFIGVAAVDVNGDGKPDVVVADANSNNVVVFLNETGLPGTELTLAGQSGGLSLSPGVFGVPNLIGGYSGNVIEGGSDGSVIAGGGSAGAINEIAANDSSIGGGQDNVIQFGANNSTIGGGYQNTNAGEYSCVGGGNGNLISNEYAFIGSGQDNVISSFGEWAVVGGGQQNTAEGEWDFVGGGENNVANSQWGTVAGGIANNVAGNYSMVGGGEGNSIPAAFAVIGGGYFNTNGGEYGVIGGGQNNIVNNAAAVVSGGTGNIAGSTDATVGGGTGNTASGPSATVGGGGINTASAADATVGGGNNNKSIAQYATVGGGDANYCNGQWATVGGGLQNQATNSYATVPGGQGNLAGGQYSFAAGYAAQATNNGAFVWADSTDTVTTSTNNNSVTFRASGGYRLFSSISAAGVFLGASQTSWAMISDRNAKKNFKPVNSRAVLDKLAAMPIQQWNYKWEKDNDVPNIGPMAQDFKAAFYPGRDDKSITTGEFDGVELAAIQGLNQKLEADSKAKDAEIEALKQSVAELKKAVQTLSARN